jgi:hypothetical protein
VSYITYSPDVALQKPAQAPASKRPLGWFIGLLIYAILCGVLIWWLAQPPPIKPPLATIALPDGRELRLLGSRSVSQIELRHSEDFGGRLRLNDYYNQGYGNTSWGSSGSVPDAEKAVLVFSLFDPRTQRFSPPALESFEIIEDETGLEFQSRINNGDDSYPVGLTSFEALPRRTAELSVRLRYKGTVLNAKMPNPFMNAGAPQLIAKPVPHVLEVDGFSFELRSVKLRKSKEKSNNPQGTRFRFEPDIKVIALAAPTAALGTSWHLFDATGNQTANSILPGSERVWGLRVTAQESNSFPFPREQMESVGKIAAPAPGQAIPLTMSQKLTELGLVAGFALGKGDYILDYATKGQASLSHINASTPSNRKVEVGKVPLTGFSSSVSVSEFGVWFFSKSVRKPRHTGELRIRYNGKILQGSGSSTSSSGDRESRFYSFNGSKNAPGSGEVEIEFIYPKKRNAEFYFDHPPLPEGR